MITQNTKEILQDTFGTKNVKVVSQGTMARITYKGTKYQIASALGYTVYSPNCQIYSGLLRSEAIKAIKRNSKQKGTVQ